MTRSIVNEELQAATTILATETAMGDAIDTRNYDQMVIWLDYTKGDETGVYVVPKYLAKPSGDEHEHMEWSVDDHQVKSAKDFYLTATGKAYIVLDVKAFPIVKLYNDANGGTPTGKLQVSYTLLRRV